MTMFRRILIPLDGSSLAECAIPYALTLHRTFSPRVLLLRVLEPRSEGSSSLSSVDWRLQRDSARLYLEDVARRFPAGAKVEVEVVTGPASDAIVEKVRSFDIDLVILSTHGAGASGSFAVGGTAHKVISAAETSVLVVRAAASASTDEPAGLQRIVVGVDGSANGEWAAHVAACMAGAVNGEVLLTYVVPRRDRLRKYRPGHDERRTLDRVIEEEREEAQRRLENLAGQVAHSAVAVRTRVEIDAVAPTLDEIACRQGQSLIVIGAHGRSSGSVWHYGSVATGLIHNGRTPVLVLQDAPRRTGKRPAMRPADRSSRLRASYAWRP